MKNAVIAIDLGATSGRMILSYFEGEKLQIEEINRFPNNIIEEDGKSFWNMPFLFEQIVVGLNKIDKKKYHILSIGVDTWGVDVCYFDKNGDLIGNPRAYRDVYTNGAPEKFFEEMPRKEVYSLTGIQVMNFNTLYQLYSAKNEKFEPFEKADSILFIPDALSYMLTGNKVCEYTILSTSQFLNPNNKQLEESLLKVAGVDKNKFPEIVMPGTVVGNLKKELMNEPFDYDIPVIAVAGHDTGSAVAAVPSKDENFAYLSSGTWSLMGIEVKDPIISDKTFELNFTNEGGVEGTTRFLKNITGMWILEQCRKEWAEEGNDYSYPEIVDMIDKAEPFRSLINTDDPSFANPSKMSQAIKDYCNKTNQPEPENHPQIVRCIMDSLALRYRQVFGYLKELAPFKINRLHIIGGGAKNALLNQFTSNSIGVPVYAGPSEATAIGNIMIQMRAHKLVGDITDMRNKIAGAVEMKIFEPKDKEIWDEAYNKFEKFCN
ncbi:MAG: rhamnulokinase family protein [Bacteroidales bacterium]|nr:rhamnulokinase family protein [Bacteroidales bacterium]